MREEKSAAVIEREGIAAWQKICVVHDAGDLMRRKISNLFIAGYPLLHTRKSRLYQWFHLTYARPRWDTIAEEAYHLFAIVKGESEYERISFRLLFPLVVKTEGRDHLSSTGSRRLSKSPASAVASDDALAVPTSRWRKEAAGGCALN